MAAVYVDDIILTGTNNTTVDALKQHLNSIFGIKDLERLHYFLSFEVSYSTDGIILSQHKFTKELLQEAALTQIKPVVTPLPLHLKLSATEGELFHDPEYYRCLVGKLNFLTNTRPNLSYSVQALSQFLHAPRISHYNALQHLLQYVTHSSTQGILLKGSEQLRLQAFSDSDWGSCPDSRRSISGYILMLGHSPISWKSKKNILSLNLSQRQSIEQWPVLHQKSLGLLDFWRKWV